MKLKILSWNIWIDSYFDKVADFLCQSNADIICLQEVEDKDPERDVIGLLSGLGYSHVFMPVPQIWRGKNYRNCLAIFSKHKIIGSEKYILSAENSRGAVRADIDVHGKILHVFTTHLIHTH